MSFFPTGGASSALPNPLAGFEGPLRVRGQRGKERKGAEVTGENIPGNKFVVTALL